MKTRLLQMLKLLRIKFTTNTVQSNTVQLSFLLEVRCFLTKIELNYGD